MRRASDVQLVVLLASVIHTCGLVSAESQEKQEPFHKEHRFSAFLQSEKGGHQRNQRQSALAEAFRALLTEELLTEEESRFQVQDRHSRYKAAATQKTSHASSLETVTSSHTNRRNFGDSSRAAQQHVEHANLLIPEVTLGVHATATSGKTQNKDEPLMPLSSPRHDSGQSVPHRTSGKAAGPSRLQLIEAWGSQHLTLRSQVVRYATRGAFSILLWAVLVMLAGLFYHHEKQHPPRLDPEGVNVSLHDRERLDRQRWRFGLLECTEVPLLCAFSFLCSPLRWADTMRMAGFMNYFSALALVVGLTVLGYLTLGIGFIALIAVAVHYRQLMRQKFDIRSQSCGSTYTSDVLAFVFCPWCSIVQEARQLEEAYLARHASVRSEYTRHAGPVKLSAVKV
jgi:Cys-rich protein (TIGR01571 family)